MSKMSYNSERNTCSKNSVSKEFLQSSTKAGQHKLRVVATFLLRALKNQERKNYGKKITERNKKKKIMNDIYEVINVNSDEYKVIEHNG